MQCIHASVCRHVISSDQDLTSVVLFNTAKTDSKNVASDFPNITILQPLARPSADRVKALEVLMEGGWRVVEMWRVDGGGMSSNGWLRVLLFGLGSEGGVYQVSWDNSFIMDTSIK